MQTFDLMGLTLKQQIRIQSKSMIVEKWSTHIFLSYGILDFFIYFKKGFLAVKQKYYHGINYY